jgi:uncharacterized alpha/beta hydrolase family protein
VHFIHVKSTKEDAIPIILLHGYALRVCSSQLLIVIVPK